MFCIIYIFLKKFESLKEELFLYTFGILLSNKVSIKKMKKKIISFYTVIILACFTTNAQDVNFIWAKNFGGTTIDQSNSIALDPLGNIYTTGTFTGIVDFDPGTGVYNLTSIGAEDIFVSKVDNLGNFIWAKQMGGTGTDRSSSIALDINGNVYTTGSFYSTADFDPNVGVYNLISAGYNDIFICKLNGSGDFVWAKGIGDYVSDYGNDITVDSIGNTYTAGQFISPTAIDFDPGPGVYNLSGGGAFTLKLDSLGNFVWANSYSNTYSNSIALDANNNVHTTGSYYAGPVDFDPGSTIFNLPGGGVFVSAVNTAGSFLWAKQVADGNAEAFDISIDNAGNIYTTGHYGGTVDFGPGANTYTATLGGGWDIFISKLDSSGTFLWAKSIGGTSTMDESRSIITDVDESIYIIGTYAETADFDPGSGVYNLVAPPGEVNIHVSKFDKFGNFTWAKSIGGTSGYGTFGSAIVIDNLGHIYTTGFFGNTVDFNPLGSVYNLTSTGFNDAYILKLCQIPAQPVIISGIIGLCPGTSETYSIEPVAFATSYTWTLPSGWTGSSTSNSITATANTIGGNITVTATNACGTSTAQTLSVAAALVMTVNSETICEGDTANLISTGATTYSWSSGANAVGIDSAIASPSTTTSYTVTGTTASCIDSVTAIVTVNPIPPTPTILQTGLLLTSSSSTGNQWYYNGTLISGETNQTYNVYLNGTYTVDVTISGCTSEISSAVVISDVGMDEILDSNNFYIYPNPNEGNFNISFYSSIKSDYTIELFNALGQSVYKEKLIDFTAVYNKNLTIAEYGKGIYTISLKNSKNQTIRKIIVF